MKIQVSPYKVLQGILEKVKERADQARYSKEQDAAIEAILDNQERIAESLLVIGTLLDTIVDKQIMIKVGTPDKDKVN